ncbi:MAG: hypothetical protein SO365_04185 [Prevotella sp.]|nr:hypothetical protein [Prevotella sp.]
MMKEFKASRLKYQILKSNECIESPFPLLRDSTGEFTMRSISPNHGRSYIVGQCKNGRYIITKGNGLAYSQYEFINTREFGDDSMGLLLKKDAIRDFNLGNEIASLGIRTDHMQYVIELNKKLNLPTGHILKPVLLQYDVECPYRINDALFIENSTIQSYVKKWPDNHYKDKYLAASEVLINNLRILHDNNILHNAITTHNITWALELLDFELACSPIHPYDTEDEQRHVKDLFAREIISTYEIINVIASILHESIDYQKVERIFKKYDFNISQYSIM